MWRVPFMSNPFEQPNTLCHEPLAHRLFNQLAVGLYGVVFDGDHCGRVWFARWGVAGDGTRAAADPTQ